MLPTSKRFFTVLIAQASADPALISQLLPFAVLAGLFYFFMIRPQRRRSSAAQALRDAASVGDDVRTIGGIHGVISSLDDDIVVVKTHDGGELKLDRRAIAKIVSPTDSQKDA